MHGICSRVGLPRATIWLPHASAASQNCVLHVQCLQNPARYGLPASLPSSEAELGCLIQERLIGANIKLLLQHRLVRSGLHGSSQLLPQGKVQQPEPHAEQYTSSSTTSGAGRRQLRAAMPEAGACAACTEPCWYRRQR